MKQVVENSDHLFCYIPFYIFNELISLAFLFFFPTFARL